MCREVWRWPCLPEYWLKNHSRESLAWCKYWLKKYLHLNL